MAADNVSSLILALERAALDRWGRGDPDGFLEISDPDVAYFDPFQSRRIDGLEALRQLYEELRGKIRIDTDEIIDPRVQVHNDVAVLTFQFISRGSDELHWNSTEVYRQTQAGWRIIHSHWAFTQPKVAS